MCRDRRVVGHGGASLIPTIHSSRGENQKAGESARADDNLPKLTPDLKIVARAWTVTTQHVGSASLQKLLEERQPMLGLHGHIHESGGEDRVGSTMVPNPGSEYNQGILTGVLVDLEDGNVVRHQFTMG